MPAKKRPWLAALLSLLAGPIGFLYIHWRYAVLVLLIQGLFVVSLEPLDIPFLWWWKYLAACIVAWKAFEVATIWNTVVEGGGSETAALRSFGFASVAMSSLLVQLATAFALGTGLYVSGAALIAGKILQGLAMLFLGTPLLTWVFHLGSGLLALGMDAVFSAGRGRAPMSTGT